MTSSAYTFRRQLGGLETVNEMTGISESKLTPTLFKLILVVLEEVALLQSG
uniref:Uncharacterized protein n=1 Tax=Arion vulgaris TaxID=1028688 RepID=A0A0B7B9X7_9EUPU